MSSVSLAPDPLDESVLEAIMIRWKLAEQVILQRAQGDTGIMALHALVSHDIPVLLRELARLRPDLAIG